MATFTRETLPNPAAVVTMIIGVIVSVILGVMSTSDEIRGVLGFIVLSVGIVIVLSLRTSIWMLIPFCWPLTGRISVLPVPFSLRDLAILTAAGIFLVMFAFKMVRAKPRRDWLDMLLWVNFIYLAIVFFRHPVGLAFLGSDQVGGRPYFNIAIGFIAYLILSRVRVSPEKAMWIPILLLGGTVLSSGLMLFTMFVPALTPVIAPFYSGISVGEYMALEYGSGPSEIKIGKTRIASLSQLATVGTLVCVSLWRPSTLLSPVYFWRFCLFMGSLGAMFLSGFRSGILALFGYFFIATFLRERIEVAVRTILLAAVVLATLCMAQGHLVELPHTMQRALAWLPGKWSEEAVEAGRQSTEWRVEMWKIALSTDRYIRDKIWGDGFGFSKRDLMLMLSADMGGVGFIGGDRAKENFMVQGSFHSGPLTAMRFVGIVGFLLYLGLLVGVAYSAYQTLRKARDSAFFAPMVFVTVPAIFEAFNYVFVFGSYDSSFPATLFSIGFLKMVQLSMAAAEAPKAAAIAQPAIVRGLQRTRLRPRSATN